MEPVSATGERGPGLIPRTPEVMRHVVAAFNGGFQAQHGEYGMEANGIEYLPPKPYAATVVELRDGSNGFGAWPNSPVVPDEIIALRQNLTALVQDGKFNPWGRNWWGGTPPGWPDQVHSARSAICMTKDGFAGYFYSTSIAAEDLGRGMLAAGCSFGIHLDMNPGHAGFEFYDVAPEGELTPLERRLQPDWEAEGKVPDMPGYAFRSRRMIRAMGHMLFPRYIQREARDFFYLTSRVILPGTPVPIEAKDRLPEEGTWRTAALPQHGFPYAIATTWVRAGAAAGDLKLDIVRADPRTMAPADRATPDAPVVLALAAPARGPLTLWWSHGAFTIAPTDRGAPTADTLPLAEGRSLTDAQGAASRAAVGGRGRGRYARVGRASGRPRSRRIDRGSDGSLARTAGVQRPFRDGRRRASAPWGHARCGRASADPSATGHRAARSNSRPGRSPYFRRYAPGPDPSLAATSGEARAIFPQAHAASRRPCDILSHRAGGRAVLHVLTHGGSSPLGPARA